MTDDQLIKIESVLGVLNGPQVRLSWGENAGLLSTAEARKHAMSILEAADAAESDAFMYHFLQNTVGIDERAAAAVIADFRRYRQAHEVQS